MKRKLVFLLAVAILLLCTSICAGAYNIGDVINYAQPTDIVASINGYQLMSYNVDGYTYIVAEDLRHYGMDVHYDNNTRSLSVIRNSWVTEIAPHYTNVDFWSIGSDKSYKNILYTDIVTYVADQYVHSYNINGTTIIRFDSLASFGKVSYDNKKREISLEITDMKRNPVAVLIETSFADVADYTKQTTDNSAKKAYGNHVSSEVFLRAKGDIMVYEIYAKGIVMNDAQKRYEQQVLNNGKQVIKSVYQSVKDCCPELKGVAMIMYDATNAEVASATIFLD